MRDESEADTTPYRRYVLIGARSLFGLLTLAALGRSFLGALRTHYVSHYFSFFTILSNFFAAVVLLVGAAYLIRRRRPTEAEDTVRGAAVVAMAIVGIVFGLLLSHLENDKVIPWVNFVTHTLMPIVMVVDWLFQPPRSKLTPKHIGFWLIYPLAYLIYSLVRGAMVGWYPYWFIDPLSAPDGWNGVALYSGAILVGFLIVGWLLISLGNRLKCNVVY